MHVHLVACYFEANEWGNDEFTVNAVRSTLILHHAYDSWTTSELISYRAQLRPSALGRFGREGSKPSGGARDTSTSNHLARRAPAAAALPKKKKQKDQRMKHDKCMRRAVRTHFNTHSVFRIPKWDWELGASGSMARKRSM